MGGVSDMLLKEKILEQYPSIANFCFINDISKSTICSYLYEKTEINSMSAKTLSRVCTALNCEPEDIGFTGVYWKSVTCKSGVKKYDFHMRNLI